MSTQIKVFKDASNAPIVNVAKGAWVSGMFVKDAEAQDSSFTNWPNTEWKYILEGEWHIEQDGKRIVGRPGDVVFVPQGADYTSLKSPFKAFFVANRPGAVHRSYKL